MDTTRRALLTTLGGSATIGLAGCLGGVGGSGDLEQCGNTDEPTVSELPSPTKGPEDAPVVVKAWKDFSCPHCATFALEVLPKIEENYINDGKVRYEHHDLPLPMNRWSWDVPSAARGVQDSMDDETFFEFADAMFEKQGDYSMDLIQRTATDVGADGCAIRGDAANETYKPVLEADKQRALDKGAQGTPAVYIKGNLVRPTWEDVKAAIESAL